MKKIRWGIVGAGRIADSFAHDMPFAGNGALVAIASRSAGKAAEFAHRHGVGRAYGSYEALFTDPEIDAVYVATPHAQHLAHASAAMRSGKAVLCEKPLTLDADECRALLTVAVETGQYLMEGMWTYFLPAVRQAVQWVKEGRIGRVRQVQADFGYPLPYDPERREYAAELGGGCLLEMGIYPVAVSRLFQQADPIGIHVTRHRAPNGVEDDLIAVLEFAESTATLATSFRCKLRNWAYVVGEEGYIAIPDFWRASEVMHYRLDECVEHFRDRRTSLGFDFEIAAVGDDLQAGRKQSSVVPLASSLKFQELMDLIRRSGPVPPVSGAIQV